MSEAYCNIIRFVTTDDGTVLNLTLEGEFKMTAGLEPNVNAFIVPYTEFEMLGGNVIREGRLEFWYSHAPDDPEDPGKPDYALDLARIVDVAVSKVAPPAGETLARAVEWRVYISDYRQRFVSPRGGRLEVGKINTKPFDADWVDAEGRDVSNNQELALQCVARMGLGPEGVPAELGNVSNCPPLADLQWLGNHAPTELARILQATGYTFCPRADGGYSLDKMGMGEWPTFPVDRVICDLAIPSTDRRGKVVIITSYPNPIVDTIKLIGPHTRGGERCDDPGGFDFVVQDLPDENKREQWVPIWIAKIFGNTGPADTIRKTRFNNVQADLRLRVEQQLYYCLRPYRSGPTKFLRKVCLKDGVADIVAKAIIAEVTQENGLYVIKNTPEPVELSPIQMIYDSGVPVLVFGRRFGLLKRGVEPEIVSVPAITGLKDDYFWELPLNSVQITITAQVTDENDNLQYHTVGYRRELGKVVRLTDDELKLALDDPDTVTVAHPELQLFRVEGEDQNLKELNAESDDLADAYLRLPGQRRTIQVKGFAAVELSGRVAEFSITQKDPQTTVTLDTWFAPFGGLVGGKIGTDEAPEAHPRQSAMADQRTALGYEGATQPVVPLGFIPAGVTSPVLTVGALIPPPTG